MKSIPTFVHLQHVKDDENQPIGMRILALTELYHLSLDPEDKARWIREIDQISRVYIAQSSQQVQGFVTT